MAKKKITRRKWTKPMERTLRQLSREFVETSLIARALDLSPQAVRSKAMHLGIKLGNHPRTEKQKTRRAAARARSFEMFAE